MNIDNQSTVIQQVTMSNDSQMPGEHEEDNPLLTQANKLYETALMLMEQKKPIDKAIKCLQKAITLDDNNYRYWQLLGEAYFHRGSLNPSINCFVKSQQLALLDENDEDDEDEKQSKEFACTHSKLRMSDIRLQAGHFDEAATGYSEIISNYPDHVDALMGLSKTNLILSKQDFSRGLVKSGHIRCMRALTLVLQAIKYSTDQNTTESWELASDCCITQYIQGQRDDYFEARLNAESLPIKSDQDKNEDDSAIILINRKSCLELAQKFLCKALEQAEPAKSFTLWHNIGICLYFRALMTNDDSEKKAMLIRAIKCYLKALDQDRTSSHIRNSIGLAAIHLKLLDIGQSFLIKSIQTNFSTSEVQFSNLGYVYLNENNIELANVAFDRCQAEEPLYSRSWLGKALINQRMGIDNLSYLRHCHRLGNNYESQLKYATKVINWLGSHEHQRDVVGALDCMTRIINYDCRCLEALNTLGLIYESCGYQNEAHSCYMSALKIEPNNHDVMFNMIRTMKASGSCFESDDVSDNDSSKFINEVDKLARRNDEHLMNYFLFLLRNQQYAKLEFYMTSSLNSISKSDTTTMANFKMISALTRHRLPSYEKGTSLELFVRNINELENFTCSEPLINITCLMILATSLKKQIEYEPLIRKHLTSKIWDYIYSWKGQQFNKIFYSNYGYWIKMALLSSIFCLQDQSHLIKTVLATFPRIAEFWLFMGISLMVKDTKRHDSTIFCVKKAALIGSSQPDLVFICDILLCLLSGIVNNNANNHKHKCHYTLDDRERYLRRAIYKYPDYHLLWKIHENLILRANTKGTTNKTSSSKSNNKIFDNELNCDLFSLAVSHVTNKLVL